MLSAVESCLVSKAAKMRSCWSTLRLEDRPVLHRDVPQVASVSLRELSSHSFPPVSKVILSYRSWLIFLFFNHF